MAGWSDRAVAGFRLAGRCRRCWLRQPPAISDHPERAISILDVAQPKVDSPGSVRPRRNTLAHVEDLFEDDLGAREFEPAQRASAQPRQKEAPVPRARGVRHECHAARRHGKGVEADDEVEKFVD